MSLNIIKETKKVTFKNDVANGFATLHDLEDFLDDLINYLRDFENGVVYSEEQDGPCYSYLDLWDFRAMLVNIGYLTSIVAEEEIK